MCRWPSTWNAAKPAPKAGGPAQALYAERIAHAEEWTQRNVGFAPSLPQAADEGLFAGLANAGADGDRRSLFTDMLSQLKDAASGTTRERTDAHLQTLREQNERFAAHQRLDLGNGTQFNRFAPHGRVKRVMGSSRNLLLQALDTQPDMAARVELSLPEIDADACEGLPALHPRLPHRCACARRPRRHAYPRLALLHRLRPVRVGMPPQCHHVNNQAHLRGRVLR